MPASKYRLGDQVRIVGSRSKGELGVVLYTYSSNCAHGKAGPKVKACGGGYVERDYQNYGLHPQGSWFSECELELVETGRFDILDKAGYWYC